MGAATRPRVVKKRSSIRGDWTDLRLACFHHAVPFVHSGHVQLCHASMVRRELRAFFEGPADLLTFNLADPESQ